jgi:DNA polymerase III subunit gamma/tau
VADLPDDTPYQSLYRRFRPATFEEVRGQDHVVLALRNAVRDGRVAHAYLFSGPRGTGKTSTARILAKALNCTDLRDGEPCGQCSSCTEIAKGSSLDVHELDAASNNGVEAMRDLVSRAALGTPGRQKVYIVDEVHMLSTPASNALLKTLEEPPAHVIFVLATTDPQKVLPTIRSRTQHFEFRLLGPDTLGALLDQVRRDANLDVADEALDLAVRRGRGSARDALSVLDQVAASDSVEDDLPQLDEVVEAMAERDVGRALVAVATLTSAGFSPQQLAGDLVDHLRQGFLALIAPDLVAVVGSEHEALTEQARRVGLAVLVRAMEVLGRAQVTMRDAPDPRVDLEVALVRLTHPEADDSPEALLTRVERLEGAAAISMPDPVHPAVPTPPSPPSPPSPPAPETRAAPASSTDEEPAASDESASAPSGPLRTVGASRRQSLTAASSVPVGSEPPPGPPVVEAPAPPARPAPATSSSVPFPTRDDLVQSWGDHIIGRLRPKAKALYQAGRFVAVHGERAVFALPNEIHRTRCAEMQPEIETVLSEHFGRPVTLELVVEPGDHAGPSPTPAPTRSPEGPPEGSSTPPPRPVTRPDPHPESDLEDSGPTDLEDLSVFDEAELGEVADVDNSAETRVLQAFPGAEEIQ